MDISGILAVGGFWLCAIAWVLKRPISTMIIKNKAQETKDVKALQARVLQLEGVVSTMNKDVFELKENSEFANQLLITSANQIAEAHKMLVETSKQNDVARKVIVESKAPGAVPPQNLLTYTPVPLSELGKIVNDSTIRFERKIEAPIEKVWDYLSSSQGVARWLAAGTLEPRVGGRVELNFDTEEVPERKQSGAHIFGVVNRYEPLKLISFSWMDASNSLDSSVTFEVTPNGEHTELVVTHTRLPKERMQNMLSGWHTHLDVLKARLTNMIPPNFGQRFREVSKTYAGVVAATIVLSATAMQDAQAATSPEAYQTIQTQRSQLQSRHDLLIRDADNLKNQIDMLKRANSDESDRAANRLQNQLDNEYRDIHKVELDIQDMSRAMQ